MKTMFAIVWDKELIEKLNAAKEETKAQAKALKETAKAEARKNSKTRKFIRKTLFKIADKV